MSGGSMDYLYSKVEEAASQMRGGNPLREAFKAHLEKVAKALHDIEWVDSCDYGDGDENEAIRAVFQHAKRLRALLVNLPGKVCICKCVGDDEGIGHTSGNVEGCESVMNDADRLDDLMRQFHAQLGGTKFPDYDIVTAIERARKFAVPDMTTRDAQGNLIIFGQSYTYQRDGQPSRRMDVAGLDLRTHGWVFVWDNNHAIYDAVPAEYLTPIAEDDS